ncbi:MAG: hypothetical protein KIT84_00490 [Labilithrix sp.]|nr:hypothetical protein [Labilithrix sp.]MCW5809461.1 hypothetical protein [Labilithrix sp.]
MLEDVHGRFHSTERLAADVASDSELAECACDLLDRRAVLRGPRVDIGERVVFARLTKRNASRFNRELRRKLAVELTEDSARILAAYVALAPRDQPDTVIDLATWRIARGK